MITKFHPSMTTEKWALKPYAYQLLNIASELHRAKHWIQESEQENLRHSLERALELIDLTVTSNQGKKSLRDLLRLREGFSRFYIGLTAEASEFTLLLKTFLMLDPEVQKLGIIIE
jgi:hypothetical protein